MKDIFKALSDETRLRILSLLLDNEMCVCEIEKGLGLTQSNASKHLAILKNCRLLESYKNAQWTFYKINKEFQENNVMLLKYLEENLKIPPTYKKDKMEFKKYREKNLCPVEKQ